MQANRQLQLVLIGKASGDFAGRVKRLADEAGLCVRICEDIYFATAVLSKMDNNVYCLVVGKFSDLSKEGFGFFNIVAKGGHKCCCGIDSGAVNVSEAVQKVLRAGALVIENTGEIEDIIFKLCKNDTAGELHNENAEIASNIKKFSPSREELDALLGT